MSFKTKWVIAKVHEINGYKLWNSRGTKVRNGIGILVDKELVDQVVEMRHKSDCTVY